MCMACIYVYAYTSFISIMIAHNLKDLLMHCYKVLEAACTYNMCMQICTCPTMKCGILFILLFDKNYDNVVMICFCQYK